MILRANTLAVMAFFVPSPPPSSSPSLSADLAIHFDIFPFSGYIYIYLMCRMCVRLAFDIAHWLEHLCVYMAIKRKTSSPYIEMIIWNTIALILNACVEILSNWRVVIDYRTQSYDFVGVCLFAFRSLSLCSSVFGGRTLRRFAGSRFDTCNLPYDCYTDNDCTHRTFDSRLICGNAFDNPIRKSLNHPIPSNPSTSSSFTSPFSLRMCGILITKNCTALL